MRSRILALIFGLFFVALCSNVARADAYGSVTGVVLDSTNHPVQGAAVTLKADNATAASTTTDPTGHFRFARVAFDTYTVGVDAAGYAPAADTVTISSGNVVTLSFRLEPKVLGRVVTTSRAASVTGQPVSVNVISRQTILALPNNSSLQKVVQTVPGVVPFSYNEPVSRGFHGVAYEVDGIPLQQLSSSNFSEIVDPRDIDRLEVFTGAMPAEFGGQRQGAVVDILTKRATDIAEKSGGTVTLFGGSYADAGASFNQAVGSGSFRTFFAANVLRNGRGLDSPTVLPEHDNSNQSDEFLRTLYSPNDRDTFALDFANQYAAYQIPINTNRSDPHDATFSVPGTDDNQQEYGRFANLTFSRISADGKGYFEIAPWYSSGRVTYLPDPASDLAGSAQASVSQNRYANYLGLTTSYSRGNDKNNFKTGLTADVENFNGQFALQFLSGGVLQPTFFDNAAQRGSNLGYYVQDKYFASSYVTINAGLRYDHSTGFVDGHQISPRVEVNLQADPKNVVHLYYGRLYAAPLLEDVRRSAVIIGGGSPSALPVYDLKPERDSIYEAGVAHTFSPVASGFLTLWARHVNNVLDTTQIGATPIFTEFNSAGGQAVGMELNVKGRAYNGNSYYLSYGTSLSQAIGISGGTFLFPVSQLQGANSWALEDHDQTNTINTAYTWNLSPSGRYATLQALYGSGFPVQFENGPGRLPVHWEVGASYGEPPSARGVGWEIDGNNLLNHVYLIKQNNGFNSTQYSAGRFITFKVTTRVP